MVFCLVFLGVSASQASRRLSFWGVGQLADRPAVNREVGGSSPPAPVRSPQRTSSPRHARLLREAARFGGDAVLLDISSMDHVGGGITGKVIAFTDSAGGN